MIQARLLGAVLGVGGMPNAGAKQGGGLPMPPVRTPAGQPAAEPTLARALAIQQPPVFPAFQTGPPPMVGGSFKALRAAQAAMPVSPALQSMAPDYGGATIRKYDGPRIRAPRGERKGDNAGLVIRAGLI